MTDALKRRDDGVLTAVAGASRMGKTGWTKQQIKTAPRLLIWDIRGEYINPDDHGWPGCERIDSIPALAKRLRETKTGKARIAYWGDVADFNAWAGLAYLWGQYWPAVIVGEEISDVTNPGKAPPGWGQMIRKGLYYGNHIYAITQRPAECDKTVWGNATRIHSHGFVLPRDIEFMAGTLGVPVERVEALGPLEYLERIAGEKQVRAGKLGS